MAEADAVKNFRAAIYGAQPYVLEFLKPAVDSVFEPGNIKVLPAPAASARLSPTAAAVLPQPWCLLAAAAVFAPHLQPFTNASHLLIQLTRASTELRCPHKHAPHTVDRGETGQNHGRTGS